MTPSAATIAAATPKCPGLPRRVTNTGLSAEPQVVCGKRLEYYHAIASWVCSDHGPVTTVASLVSRQKEAA